jgi:O-antigen/teichoic acid export membrane protein
MSRTRKAITTAGFNYLQLALGIVTGVVLVPLTIRCLGVRTYGLWLACGELIAYLALSDAGVFSVLPWVVAVADGRGDRPAIRQFLANGLVVGLFVGSVILAGGAAVWLGFSGWLDLTAADRDALFGPFLLLVTVTAAAYPLRVFAGALSGLQDVVFLGSLGVAQSGLTVLLTVGLLLADGGAYALAAAAAVPFAVNGLACLWRVTRTAPELLAHWPRPSAAAVWSLFREGVGGWLGGFGGRLLTASNGLIIAALRHPEWVAVYACTAKVANILQQICWVLPDSGLVGLAQLHGEGRPERVRQVVRGMLDLHLLLTGSAACAVLAFNPLFVQLWVGPELYGGHILNALLVGGLLASTVAHAVITPVAVVGHRLQAGLATVLNGVVYVGLALWLGELFGLPGLAAASVIAALATTLAWGLRLMRHRYGLTPGDIWAACVWPWLWRVGPVFALAGWVGVSLPDAPRWAAGVALVAGGLAYLWWVRPLWLGLPLPGHVRRWLVRLRLAVPVEFNP